MTESIYLVLSKSQDECSCNNRYFDDYSSAWTYAQAVAAHIGCSMIVINVPKADARDLALIPPPS